MTLGLTQLRPGVTWTPLLSTSYPVFVVRGPYDDDFEVLAASFNRRWRIVSWLLIGTSFGASKAGSWMLEGVPRDVALVFGAFYSLHVLIIVWMVYVIITRALPVGLRLWARHKPKD